MGGLTPRRLGDISYHRVMSFLMSPNSLFRDLNNPFSLLIYLIHMLIHKNPTHTLNFISPYSAYLILLPRYPHFISYQNQGIPIHSSTCSPAHLGGLMAQLYEILMDAGVQETFADKLKDDGWTVELFRNVCDQSGRIPRRAPRDVGDISPHHHTNSTFCIAFGLASMSSNHGPATWCNHQVNQRHRQNLPLRRPVGRRLSHQS